ncbi:MAG: hypothetical protein ABI166_10760 [Mucilaginibacter sp.]
MNYPINYIDINVDTEFYSELEDQYLKAETYLKTFRWCKEIKACSLYANLGKVFCIFLFEIDNTASVEDDFLWIIVGDIPSMYLDTFGAKSTKEVIENYVGLAEDWINNIKAGKDVYDCYPFNAEPTLELADLLEKKISFMKSELIENMVNIKFEVKS